MMPTAFVENGSAQAYDVLIVYCVASFPLLASLAALLWQPGKWNRDFAAVLTVEVAALLIVPRVYVHARCQHDAARVVELAQQSRIGEARALAHCVLALSPNATWKGNSLRSAAENLDRAASQIERRVEVPLPGSASLTERLSRARDLAMLGRTDEAIQVLDAASQSSAEADNLRGTIEETRGHWRRASDWYARARQAWLLREESAERSAGLLQAVTGVAFCERKLGRFHEAEAAWLERLEIAPTAESHFLLAQFYEDTQQAQKARLHAQEAMRLAPERYAQLGRRLLDKLVTSHFGCLGVFRAESSPSTPFGAARIENQ